MSTDTPGNAAPSPWRMTWPEWKQVVLRSWREASDDNVGLVAAGVAFYGFLALVPLLGAIVLSYGLVAEPSTVMRNMQQLTSVMPAEAAKMIGGQLLNVVQTSGGKKGLGLLLALGIALFGARNGAGSIVIALNIAYEEKEKRGFLSLNLLALAITGAAVGVAIIAMIAIAALGHLEELLPQLPDWVSFIGKVASYLFLTGAAAGMAATLYRYGPSRRKARWVWMTPGSLFTAISWLVLTLGFGAYVANFGNYDATYGSLGTVVVLLTWLYLSSYLLLFGAELNSEFEHQTSADSTVGAAKPVGDRGACVADNVATDDAPEAPADQPRVMSGLTPPKELAARMATSQATALVSRAAGFGKADMLSSGLASFGLTRIRRGEKPLQGLALLASAGALAWLRREAHDVPGRVKAVLFDLDGTLVDSNDFHVRAWQQAFGKYGYKITRAAIHDQIGKGGDLLIPALLPGLSKSERSELSETRGKLFKEQFLARVRPFPGARALLEAAHRRGQRVILASSASQAEVDHYIGLLDATRLVGATTSIDDVANSKPEPDIFEAALKKAGVPASEAIVVGDTPYDIEAAARCGIAAVAVRSGGFDDGQLAGAAALYDDVAALLDAAEHSPLAA